MKNKILLSPFILVFSFLTLKGQQEYMVGTSRVSTEPDSTLFSIALSGYGYPAEGRFSINWILCGTAPANIVAITSLDGIFIAADSNRILWSGSPLGSIISWKKIGLDDGIKVLAGMTGRVYAVNDKGELLMRKTVLRNSGWKRIATAADIKTLAVLDGMLYATNTKNELMKMNPLLQKKYWTNIGSVYDVRSMTSYGERLYAINAGDTLWHIQPYKAGIPGTKIGRNNGITFDIHINQIAVLNNRLYALSNDNKLYIGQHSTDGNLSAGAFAVKRNGKTVVLVGVDLTGFDYSLTDEVKEIVSKARKIPKSAILINASHTHFSPSAQAYPAWEDFLVHPDSLYLNNILKKAMVSAIENAMDNMSPADLYFGRGITEIGKNRSAKDSEFPHDKTLDVLEAKDNTGKITGILFLTGCHVVFNSEGREGYTMSANFPGITRDMIRRKTGTEAIFIQGCGGDINPRSTDHKETGRQLAADIFRVMNENMTKITGDISYTFNTLHLPVQPSLPAKLNTNDIPVVPTSRSAKPLSIDLIRQVKINNAQNTADLYARRNVKWADMMLTMYKNGTLPETVPEYIQIINIGGWKLVGLSREVVTEYGPAIRNIWPVKNVSVAGYCNDVSSYLPNKWHVTNQHYEGYDSFFWYGQPGVMGENVFDIIINGIKSLAH